MKFICLESIIFYVLFVILVFCCCCCCSIVLVITIIIIIILLWFGMIVWLKKAHDTEENKKNKNNVNNKMWPCGKDRKKRSIQAPNFQRFHSGPHWFTLSLGSALILNFPTLLFSLWSPDPNPDIGLFTILVVFWQPSYFLCWFSTNLGSSLEDPAHFCLQVPKLEALPRFSVDKLTAYYNTYLHWWNWLRDTH